MRRISQLALVILVLVGVFAAACEQSPPTATERENETRAQNAESLAQKQPAVGMDYSPTRDSLRKWADTWEQQGKLSYVYFFNSSGELGYFIFEGLPASYCASLTPPEEVKDVDRILGGSSVDAVVLPAPALDAAYYSGSGCQQFFGYEAGTGNYFEFTVGGDFNYFLSDNPMTELDMKPIGDTTEEEAKKLN